MDICPKCGHRMRKKWNNCPKCKFPLTSLPVINNSHKSNLINGQAGYTCPICGAVSNKQGNFCQECGSKLFYDKTTGNCLEQSNNSDEYVEVKSYKIDDKRYGNKISIIDAPSTITPEEDKSSLSHKGCGCLALIVFLVFLIGSCSKSPEPKKEISPKSSPVTEEKIDLKPKDNIKVNNAKSNIVVPPVTTPVQNNAIVNKRTVQVVGNRKSGVYHRPGCSSVGRMKSTNKVFFDSREDARASGYRPCQRCGG